MKQPVVFLSGLPIKLHENPDGSFSVDVVYSGGFPEYRILSTETYPEAKPEEKGAVLLIMDKKKVYMNHGTSWEEF